jgi:hypothetical protein
MNASSDVGRAYSLSIEAGDCVALMGGTHVVCDEEP